MEVMLEYPSVTGNGRKGLDNKLNWKKCRQQMWTHSGRHIRISGIWGIMLEGMKSMTLLINRKITNNYHKASVMNPIKFRMEKTKFQIPSA